MDLYGGPVVLMVPYSHWKHWLHFRMMSEISKAGENAALPSVIYASASAWILALVSILFQQQSTWAAEGFTKSREKKGDVEWNKHPLEIKIPSSSE